MFESKCFIIACTLNPNEFYDCQHRRMCGTTCVCMKPTVSKDCKHECKLEVKKIITDKETT